MGGLTPCVMTRKEENVLVSQQRVFYLLEALCRYTGWIIAWRYRPPTMLRDADQTSVVTLVPEIEVCQKTDQLVVDRIVEDSAL